MRRLIKRVLFGKRKNYKKNFNNKYVTWFVYNQELNRLNTTVDNLLKKLKLQRLGNSNMIGDKKDAKPFEKQWS